MAPPLLLWAGLTALFASSAAPSERPPNIVFILADDLGWVDLGSYGNTRLRTPHTDRLAKEGSRFTHFYAAAPICSPSRAALLTGLAPERLGITSVLFPGAEGERGLAGVETLGDVLRRRGYATACIGKWHLGSAPSALPLNHGFDRFFGLPYSNDMLPFLLYDQNRVVERHATKLAAGSVMASLTGRLTRAATQFIESSSNRPFFLYLAHVMPHGPVAASVDFVGRSKAGLRGDAIEELDWSMGQIVSALARTGHDRDTLLVFTSDNGGVGKNGRLRGGKFSYFEGGLRVPTLVRWPGHVPAGRVIDSPLTQLDWMPTLVRIASATPPRATLDGRDISTLLLGATLWNDAPLAFWDRAIRDGRFKLVLDKKEGALLFDLDADPGEARSVASQHPDVLKRLEADLRRVAAERARATVRR